MKTYQVRVTQTETYCNVIDVEAPSEAVAIRIVEERFTLESLSDEKNTYQGCETVVEIDDAPPAVHTVEELFDIDEEDSNIEVIRVDDLSRRQKELLGLLTSMNDEAVSSSLTFQVGSSGGGLVVDSTTGKVLHCMTHHDEDNELKKIVRFDVEEYRRFHGIEIITGYVDILDIGYTTSNNQYEPPVADWREEMRKQSKNNLEGE